MENVTLIKGFPGIYERPTKENIEKAGIMPIRECDAGVDDRILHTYTFNNKLLGGKGSLSDMLIYDTERDYVLIDDITGMTEDKLREVWPNKYYSF